MLPGAGEALQTTLVTIALIGLVYGGLLAWRQTDLKAMIAYSSISHMGVVLVGIATLNVTGITGAVMQMVAHGLVAGALFLLIGLLYERTHTRDIRHYSSLVRSMPRFAFFTILAFIAAVGLPGTAGFVAELHTLIGGFQVWGWLMAVTSIGVLVGAAYAVRTVSRLFTGPISPRMRDIPDLTRSELIAASVLTAGTVLIGIFPEPALRLSAATAAHLSAGF
jgi:NADH-quinone oxidoreductase subunit M